MLLKARQNPHLQAQSPRCQRSRAVARGALALAVHGVTETCPAIDPLAGLLLANALLPLVGSVIATMVVVVLVVVIALGSTTPLLAGTSGAAVVAG